MLATATRDHTMTTSFANTLTLSNIEAGAAKIEIEDGPTLELGVGDIASMPEGAVTTWHLSPGFRELWVLG